MNLFIFALFTVFLSAEGLRHEDEESWERPTFRPGVSSSKGFKKEHLSSIRDIISGCYKDLEKIDQYCHLCQFQDCIAKEGNEKFAWPLHVIVSYTRNDRTVVGDCDAKYIYGDYGVWVGANCKETKKSSKWGW